MKPMIVFLIMSGLVSVLVHPNASACSCEFPGSPLQELQNSSAVFFGKIIEIRLDSATHELRLQVEVFGYWKGIASSPVTIYTAINEAACGYPFVADSSYLIYAEYYADALHASFCSRTIELSRAAYDIAQLGPPMPLGIREENVAPATYLLSQNYPNPFNPVTTIRFEVPASGFVSLKVFNLLGEEIVTVVSEQLYPGTYTRQWNADKVASGVYYYRLSTRQQESGQADIFSETKKLILLK